MLDALKQREAEGRPIRVGLIGAGAMGTGIAWQVSRTPGMELVFIGDIDLAAAVDAAEQSGHTVRHIEDPNAIPPPRALREVFVTGEPLALLEGAGSWEVEVLVEASNTVGAAARYCLAAIGRGLDVVLMNAEVDLALGPLLHAAARKKGVVLTSDAGDQHGVLRTMIDEIQLWGFEIVQAGNIKGFLDRDATPESIAGEAAKRRLSAIQCCAYTDGTKLSIEMACLANSVGLLPTRPGMTGPRADRVEEAFDLFDFESYGGQGRIDYLLGAEPGGGVYVVGASDAPFQQAYMAYYKMGDGPYYLFYRPYHLCHVETPRAIAEAAIGRRAVMAPAAGRVTDVFAYAKRDLRAGEPVEHAIGGAEFYGLVDDCAVADAAGHVPLALLEAEGGRLPVMRADLARGEPLTADQIDVPASFLVERYREQCALLGTPCPF